MRSRVCWRGMGRSRDPRSTDGRRVERCRRRNRESTGRQREGFVERLASGHTPHLRINGDGSRLARGGDTFVGRRQGIHAPSSRSSCRRKPAHMSMSTRDEMRGSAIIVAFAGPCGARDQAVGTSNLPCMPAGSLTRHTRSTSSDSDCERTRSIATTHPTAAAAVRCFSVWPLTTRRA
jgi:hypothetical protein